MAPRAVVTVGAGTAERLFRGTWRLSARFEPETSRKYAETGELHRKGSRQIEKGQGWTWKAPSTARRVAIPVTLHVNKSAPRSAGVSPL